MVLDWTNINYLNQILVAFYERMLALNFAYLPVFKTIENNGYYKIHSYWQNVYCLDGYYKRNAKLVDNETFKETFLIKAGADVSHKEFFSYIQNKIEEIATNDFEEDLWATQFPDNETHVCVNRYLKTYDKEETQTNNEAFLSTYTALDNFDYYYNVDQFRQSAGLNPYGYRRSIDGINFIYGYCQAGDVIGPWLFEDIQKALGALKTTVHKRSFYKANCYSKTYTGDWGESLESCISKCDNADCILDEDDYRNPCAKTIRYVYDKYYGTNDPGKYAVTKYIRQAPVDYKYVLTNPKNIIISALTVEEPGSYPVNYGFGAMTATGYFDSQHTGAIENKYSMFEEILGASNVVSTIIPSFNDENNLTPCQQLGELHESDNQMNLETGFNVAELESYAAIITDWTFTN